MKEQLIVEQDPPTLREYTGETVVGMEFALKKQNLFAGASVDDTEANVGDVKFIVS